MTSAIPAQFSTNYNWAVKLTGSSLWVRNIPKNASEYIKDHRYIWHIDLWRKICYRNGCIAVLNFLQRASYQCGNTSSEWSSAARLLDFFSPGGNEVEKKVWRKDRGQENKTIVNQVLRESARNVLSVQVYARISIHHPEGWAIFVFSVLDRS